MKALLSATATVASILFPGLFPGVVGAQLNTTVLSRFNPRGQTFNDVWGYVSPAGKEYAILGTTTGTYVVDCTDPTQPVSRAFIRASASGWSSSGWRDMRSYGSYVYVVTEGGGGMQIIDMTDSDHPRLLTTWGRSRWSNAHNVAIDTGAGVLYACGTNRGTQIVSLADPRNPAWIGEFRTRYVHDLHVQDGFAHMGEIQNGRYEIVDVANLPTTTVLGNTSVSSCHNAWPTRDNDFVITSSERSGGAVTVIDITNKRSPRRIATWRTGRSTTSVHNVYIRDRVGHLAYYSEGYRAIDLSDPANPVEVANHDTSSSTSGFNGNWGCYPFQPSGVIYASDRSNGLYVISTPAANRRYGQGTAGFGGAAPRIHGFGAPYRGNTRFRLELDGGHPDADGILILGVAPGAVSVQGINLLVDAGQVAAVMPVRTDSAGKASIGLPLDARTPRGSVFAQFVVSDPQAPGGLAATRGLEFRVFSIGDR